MTIKRDMTVGELIDLLSEFPRYYSVAPVINGVKGICTAVRPETTGDDGASVLIGEVDLPASLQESLIHPNLGGAA